MNLDSYLPVLLFILVGLAVGAGPLVIGALLGPRKPDPEKLSPYECGFEAFEDARDDPQNADRVGGARMLGARIGGEGHAELADAAQALEFGRVNQREQDLILARAGVEDDLVIDRIAEEFFPDLRHAIL